MANLHRTPWRGKRLMAKEQKAISHAVVVEGKTYQAVGDKYGRSRERIRQIVNKLNPDFKGSRAKVAINGYCTRCGDARRKPMAPQRTRRNYFGNEDDLCSACRALLYKQPVELICEGCKEPKSVSLSWVKNMRKITENRGGGSFLKIGKGELKGSHLCQKCLYKLMRQTDVFRKRDLSPLVTARCIGCGDERIVRLSRLRVRRKRHIPEKQLVLVLCRECTIFRINEVDISSLSPAGRSPGP